MSHQMPVKVFMALVASICHIIFHNNLFSRQGRQGKSFQCSQCAQEFDDKLELKSHLEVHALEKPFICEKCKMNFTNQVRLVPNGSEF